MNLAEESRVGRRQPKKNFVFNAAPILRSRGLSSPSGRMRPWTHWSGPQRAGPRVQRITQNRLRRAIG